MEQDKATVKLGKSLSERKPWVSLSASVKFWVGTLVPAVGGNYRCLIQVQHMHRHRHN